MDLSKLQFALEHGIVECQRAFQDGRAGKYDERYPVALETVYHVQYRVLRLAQPAWNEVLGYHRPRDVEDKYDIPAAPLHRPRLRVAPSPRRSSAAPMVALAAALMVAWEPTVLRDLSFQLSFAATASISI